MRERANVETPLPCRAVVRGEHEQLQAGAPEIDVTLCTPL